MTREQIIQALKATHKILEILYNDEGWYEIANDESTDPELEIHMGDALHYVGEMISKL